MESIGHLFFFFEDLILEIMITLLICSFYVLTVQCELTLEADRPSQKVRIGTKAVLKCCFTSEDLNIIWIKTQHGNKTYRPFVQTPVTDDDSLNKTKKRCGILTVGPVKLNDTGFYQCILNNSKLVTHGTYLQVYVPLKKYINLRESVKNEILIAEGVLLLLCVILPSAKLLCKSKTLNNLEKKKMKKEEENIYQGLNLDDCCAAYDQIERSQGSGPYQDVCNHDEDIQLEKP